MQRAATHFGRVLKSVSSIIARHRPVSVSEGAAGNRSNVRTTLITVTIKFARNAVGANAIQTIGANIGARIHFTASATALSKLTAMPGYANA